MSDEKLGRYTLVRRIGKGGMGEVWLAKAIGAHGFEKNIALKRILPQFSSNPHVINMLVDEARISVLLNHPNVVQVLELGEEHGDYFIAMEYVDGHALSRLLRRLKKAGEKLDVLEACYVAIQLLEGLHAAHVQKDHRGKPAGIIHRDVSPQNVLLSMDGVVKVIDFGIARARERLEVTQGANVKGKLRYMAPEQLSPKLIKGKALDHRVDVFAAGIVLYEMLANKLRFDGDEDMEIMDAILKEDTPDLARAGLIERELMDVLDTSMEKDRERRFKDAASFAAHLRGYLYKRDPGFTAERIARRMRAAFGGDGDDDGEQQQQQAPAGRRGRDAQQEPLHARDEVSHPSDSHHDSERDVDADATKTQFRPPARRRGAAMEPDDDETGTGVEPRQARSSRSGSKAGPLAAGVIIGSALLAALFFFVVKPRVQPKLPQPPAVTASPPAGASGTASPLSSSAGQGTGAPVTAAGTPTLSDDGWLDVTIVAEPATTRISLATQPDPKYVSPARLRARPGEQLDLVFEADGFQTERRAFIVTPASTQLKVALHALPVDLVIHVVPRDAVVTVNGQPARPGMKVIPGQMVEVRAEHPFGQPRVVQAVPAPGETFIVDIQIDEVDKPVAAGSRLPKGVLFITSKPKGGEVFVDGQKVKGVTPLYETVIAGQHRVTVRGPNGEQTFAVTVVDGGTAKIEAVLE